MFLRMIGRTYERSAFYLLKAFLQSDLLVCGKLFGSDVFCYRIMPVAGLQVLSDGENFTSGPPEGHP